MVKNIQITNPDVLNLIERALESCKLSYSEFNQFEGEWNQSFDEKLVKAALEKIKEIKDENS